MHSLATIRNVLEEVRNGTVTLDEAERRISGLQMEVVEDIARLDLGRPVRCGTPEIILAEGKEPKDLASIAVRLTRASGRCIISRVGEDHLSVVSARCKEEGIEMEVEKAAKMVILSCGVNRPVQRGVVAILTAGTADIPVAEEARVISLEMGCTVRIAYDVGVAGIHRLFSALKGMTDAHVYVVAAGREGTLPAIVAGLVDSPVIGVPVSSGYGHMGKGEAALASMLQSCSVLAVVNIDAGVTAGIFAARIARMVTEHE
ncbi:MAG: nickel pincer cofactor biosynthesis protein LarB [Methanomicrobiales archaeon]|nr:nickel pincer cofactor biosynthesis protein LarB [Methanomicrobiales archaeon]